MGGECKESLVSLVVDTSGADRWIFTDDDRDFPCKLQNTLQGKTLISRNAVRMRRAIVSEPSIVSVPFGSNSNRICFNCLKYGHKQVKTPEGHPHIFYCSMKCLQALEPFVDCCGSLCFNSSGLLASDTQCMILKMLYGRRCNSQIADAQSVSRALQHEKHASLPMAELKQLSAELHSRLNSHSSATDLLAHGETSTLLDDLCRVLHFNSQPFSLPDIPSANIRCLFHTLSRLNHSCSPNCTLAFCIGPGGAVIGSLVPIRHIAANEELSICYLSQPCSSLHDRHNLLRTAFNFTCACPKCRIEGEGIRGGGGGCVELGYLLQLQKELQLGGEQVGGRGTKLLQSAAKRIAQLEQGIEILLAKAGVAVCDVGAAECLSESSLDRTIVSAVPYVYAIHDVGMLLLDALNETRARKLPHLGAGSESAGGLPRDEMSVLTVRVCSVMYHCWMLSGSYFLTMGQVNVLLAGGAAASRLINSAVMARGSNSGRCSSLSGGVEVNRQILLDLIQRGKVLVQIGVSTLDMYYEACTSHSKVKCVVNPYENIRSRAIKLLNVLS